MPRVNTLVKMSCYAVSPASASIGTDGLGTCVGIVLTCKSADGSDVVFCGHMASNVQVKTASEVPEYAKQAERILLDTLKDEKLSSFAECWMSTTSTDNSTKAITLGFTEALGSHKIHPTNRTESALYFDGKFFTTKETLTGKETVNTPNDWNLEPQK